MMKNILRAGALLLALTLAPLAATASAHDHGKHKRGRKHRATTLHSNHRNLTPGVPRRVRRGRNLTPGVRRGSFAGTPSTFPAGEGRRLGAAVRRDGNRGKGGGRGHGHGHGKH
ncbi:MAG TPA: hypothetical protein VM864_12280 [Pyrinomonadaceae bacterium]|jgi:hypothetical protein|nr:hypothetical protein [Pyrinomonadaceae bacterium]